MFFEASGPDRHSPDRRSTDVGSEPPWEPPDALDEVVEVADMMSVFAAQRYVRVHAMRREALVQAAPFRGGVPELIERSVRWELAAALRITEIAAQKMLTEAEALVERYPAMLDALSGARTTERHVAIFVEMADTVEPELRDEVVPEAVELAQTLPIGSFRRALRRLVDTVRSATLAQRHTEALRGRRVVLQPADDGMAWLSAYLPAVEAHAALNRITRMATALSEQSEETRTLDQLRADAFGDLLVDGRADAHPEAVRGIRATVAVTVPVLSLLDDTLAAASEPPVVEGVGPIPIERARQLCGGDEGWMRVLTHPESGVVLSVGRTRYRPPDPLKRLVRWRAARCVGPGCGVPADRCQIDHTVAWEDGGHTGLDNLAPLCAGHHTLKHHGGWHVRQKEGTGGEMEWTSPAGRRYVVQPERRVPAFRGAETAPTNPARPGDSNGPSNPSNPRGPAPATSRVILTLPTGSMSEPSPTASPPF